MSRALALKMDEAATVIERAAKMLDYKYGQEQDDILADLFNVRQSIRAVYERSITPTGKANG